MHTHRLIFALTLLLGLMPRLQADATLGGHPQAATQPSVEKTEILAYLEAIQRRSRFNGAILVARGGDVLFQQGIGLASFELGVSNTPQTLFRIASVTKHFTATAVLHLSERGLLSLEDSLDKYLPDFREGDKIQIKHLLSHTSGIANYTRMAEFPLHRVVDRDTILNSVKTRPLAFPPGTKVQYSNTGYLILGLVIEKVSGKDYEAYLKTHFFDPLGMTNTFVESDNRVISELASGYEMSNEEVIKAKWFYRNGGADGAICSTADDLFTWYQAHAKHRILGPTTQEAMYTGYRDSPFGCFASRRFERRLIYHSGNVPGIKAHIDHYIEDDICIIILSNLAIDYQVREIARDVAAILFNETYSVSPPKPPIALGLSALGDYTGDYHVAADKQFTVLLSNGKLYTRFTRHSPQWIYPCGEDLFAYRWQETELQFVRDGEGNVVAVEFIGPRSKARLQRAAP